MSRNTIATAILALILVAAIALPVSAAQGTANAAGQAGKIDPQLKSDLWNTYGQYRLQVYDTRVQGANAIVTSSATTGAPRGTSRPPSRPSGTSGPPSRMPSRTMTGRPSRA